MSSSVMATPSTIAEAPVGTGAALAADGFALSAAWRGRARNTPAASTQEVLRSNLIGSLFLLAERKAREGHDALRVDVPLLVLQDLPASVRHHPRERVEGRGSAPLEVV